MDVYTARACMFFPVLAFCDYILFCEYVLLRCRFNDNDHILPQSSCFHVCVSCLTFVIIIFALE